MAKYSENIQLYDYYVRMYDREGMAGKFYIERCRKYLTISIPSFYIRVEQGI